MVNDQLEDKISKLPKNFFEKVDFSGDCWLWTAGTARGYGLFGYKRKNISAHRFSWKHFNGDIPDGMKVLHKCDVRNCINPSHLFLGTSKENTHDMLAKGRNNTSKLNKDQVIDIRRAYKKFSKGEFSTYGLARKYGVDQKTISNIVNNKQWQWVAV